MPGRSGNPKGRPRGKTLTELIRAKLAEADGDGDGQPLDSALARVFVASALAGDFRFAKEIIDRLDGKVPDRIAGADGGALTIRVQYADLDPAAPALGPTVDPPGDEAV